MFQGENSFEFCAHVQSRQRGLIMIIFMNILTKLAQGWVGGWLNAWTESPQYGSSTPSSRPKILAQSRNPVG